MLDRGHGRGYLTPDEIFELAAEFDQDVDDVDLLFEILEAEGVDVEDGDSEGASAYERAVTKEERGPIDAFDIDDTLGLYFRDVRPIPLLTREEEVELAQRIERGEKAERKLDRAGDDLEPGERARLEAEIAQGREAVDKLIESNYRLVISIAKKYRGQGVPVLDLIQEGNLGLVPAVEKFDHRKGNKFGTYATWWIRQAVRRALADQGTTIRIPVHMKDRIRRVDQLSRELERELGRRPSAGEIAEATELSLLQVKRALDATQQPISLEKPVGDEEGIELADFIEADDMPDPADEIDQMFLSQEVSEALAALTPRESRILALRYGLNGGREYTLKEIGEKFGVTRERIRQIEKEALQKLRHPQRSRRLRAYLN